MTPNTTNLKIKVSIAILLIFILKLSVLHSQSSIENLERNLSSMTLDSNYVDSLNELSFLYFRIKPDTTKRLADRALNLADSLIYKNGKGDAYMRLGMYHRSKGNFKVAIENYKKALKIRQAHTDKNKIANVYNNLGLCYFDMGDLSASITEFRNGLSILKNEKLDKIKGSLYVGLADVFNYQGNNISALAHLDSSYQVYKSLNHTPGLARVLNSKGFINLDLKNISQAQENFSASLGYYQENSDANGIAACHLGLGNANYELGNYEDAIAEYEKCLKAENSLNKMDIAVIYYNLGSIYRESKKLNSSLKHFSKSEQLFKELEQEWAFADIYYELGNINYDLNNYTIAKNYYIKSLQYSELDFDPFSKADSYKNLSEAYSILKQVDSAFHFSKLYNDLRDSIYYNRVDAVNFQANLEESKKENAELKLAISENEKQNLWIYGILTVSILTILLLLSGLLFYRGKQKRKETEYQLYLAEEDVLQANRKVDDLLQNQELKMTYAKLEAKDETQKKIGQDLHDRIGVMLSTIKLYFNDFSEQLKKVTQDTSGKQVKAIELLDEAVKEVRRISQDMQSGVLKKFGLAQAVQDLGDTIKNSGQIDVEVKIHGLKERIPNQIEVKIYKIIQELISNVLKHAKANKLTVYLHRHDELFNLIVEDDGIGFDKASVDNKGGMGLKNIAFRVAELNGKIHFDSVLSSGTNVVIDIPIKNIPKT